MLEIRSERNKRAFLYNNKTLACYILAGYPDEEKFFDVLEICNMSQFDILEIGFPSHNPYLDGSVISDAHGIVDKEICTSLEYWRRIREKTEKPIWLMGYFEDLMKDDICKTLYSEKLIDGLVVPDISNQERERLYLETEGFPFDIVGFTNPNMPREELTSVFETFPIVYEQLYVGQTGSVTEKEMYHPMLELSKEYKNKYGLAGFGISRKGQVEKLYSEGFEGAIIGTGIVRHLNESLSSMKHYMDDLGGAKEKWQ